MKAGPPGRGQRRTRPPSREELEAQIQLLLEETESERQEAQSDHQTLVQAQRDLQVSRQRCAELYNLAAIGHVTLDRNGVIRAANLAAAQLLGVEQRKLIGRMLENFVIPVHRRLMLEYFRTMRKEAVFLPTTCDVPPTTCDVPPTTCDVRLQTADGKTITVQLHGVRGMIGAESGIGSQVALVDISGQRRAEEELRLSEWRFRTMANVAPVLIWISDASKACTWFNEQWLGFVGAKLEDELGSGWVRHVHPEDRDRCVRTYEQAYESREEFRMEYRLRRRDGEWRWVLDHGVPLPIVDDQFNGFVGSCVDITEHKKTQTNLEASQTELRRITEGTPVMLTRCSRDLRYLFANIAYAACVGRSPEDVVGKPIRDVLGESAYETILPHIEKVLAGQTVDYEAEIAFPQTGPRHCQVAYVPDRDAAGEVTGWVAAITDITEHKQEERRLQVRNAINRSLADSTTLEQAALSIIETLCNSTGWHTGAVWLVAQNGSEMWCVNFWQHPAVPVPEFEADTRRRRYAIGEGVPGHVWSTGELRFMADLGSTDHFLRAASAQHDRLRSGVCFPIKLGKKVLGVVELFSRQRHEPSQGFLDLLGATGDKLGQFVERKQAEAALRMSEERMRHILETTLDAVITFEADGVITAWNPQAEQIFGWTQEEAVGQKLFERILPPRHRAAHEQSLRHYLDTGEGLTLDKRIELTALHRSEREFPAELTITPLVLEDRVSFAAFLRDITDRKAADEELQRHVEEMAAANADLECFNRAAVGRELRMIELKKEVNQLCAQAGLPPRYDLAFAGESAGEFPRPQTAARPMHPSTHHETRNETERDSGQMPDGHPRPG